MIFYTKHAKERMVLRLITEDMIRKALLKPDKIGIGYDDKSLVFKDFKNGTIKIVFTKMKNSYLIISVIWELIK